MNLTDTQLISLQTRSPPTVWKAVVYIKLSIFYYNLPIDFHQNQSILGSAKGSDEIDFF